MNTNNQINKETKVWFITGATRGIGSDLVTESLCNGHQVVATARSTEAIIEAVGEHDNLLAITMDVTNTDEVKSTVEKAITHPTLCFFGYLIKMNLLKF